jgi:hypothetical protein
VANILGCPADAGSIENCLANNPDKLVEIQKYEMDHIEELQRLDIQEAIAYLADRQNARLREIETTRATGKRDWFLYLLAGVFVCGFFILMGLLMFREVQENTVLTMVVGALVSGVSMVLSYFFGSSKGSNDKTLLMNKNSGGNDGR